MKKAIVQHNQSLLDIAIQYTGRADSIFAIAKENGLGVSDDLEVGSWILIPQDITLDHQMIDFYISKKIKPATAIATQNVGAIPEGIGYWIISDNNIVS